MMRTLRTRPRQPDAAALLSGLSTTPAFSEKNVLGLGRLLPWMRPPMMVLSGWRRSLAFCVFVPCGRTTARRLAGAHL